MISETIKCNTAFLCKEMAVFSLPKKELTKKGRLRQHFVPKSYLKNFGDLIYCYDKKLGKKFRSTPTNIAVKPDFYGGEYEELPSLETEFSKMESFHSRSIKKLIQKKNYYDLSYIEKIGICEFFGFQYLRTEQSRQNIGHMMNSLYEALFSKSIPKELKVKASEKAITGMHLSSLKDYRKFSIIFFNMRFVVFENYTSIPFWTSDNPISKQNEYDEHPFGNLGLTNQGIEIHLPLTPKLSICALEPILFHAAPPFQEVYKKPHVIRENFLQVQYSTRFVYSNTSKFFQIKNILQDNPHLKDDKRSNFGQFVQNSKKQRIFINSERNDRWPIKNGEIMGKMKTWIEPDDLEYLLKQHKKEFSSPKPTKG